MVYRDDEMSLDAVIYYLCVVFKITLVLKRRLMTPLERLSTVRSDGRHTDMVLLSRLERAESNSSLPLATVRARPVMHIKIQRW